MGKKAKKFPMDAWVFQEIIHEVSPDAIIEIGNLNGGSTLFLAHMLDILGKGKVLGIDIDHSRIDFKHHRIKWITGDANSPRILTRVRESLKSCEKVMVVEDSSHTYSNTLNVLRNYNSFVSVGSYFIVEDGICKYQFIDGPKPGPYDAVTDFLKENNNFVVDKSREKFIITYNPNGYLKRVR
jgi:cephalosporin hydroxylase